MPIRPRAGWVRPSVRSLTGHRYARPIAAALCSLASLWILHHQHREAEQAEAAWGTTVEAWRSVAALPAGHRLTPGDVEVLRLPEIAVPADPATAPIGERLHEPVGRGEILRADQLRPGTTSAAGASLDDGRGAILLSSPAPHLTPGDLVDLYDAFATTRVTGGAEVIAVVDTQVLVAVSTQDLSAVVGAAATGDLVPVLVG